MFKVHGKHTQVKGLSFEVFVCERVCLCSCVYGGEFGLGEEIKPTPLSLFVEVKQSKMLEDACEVAE